MLTLSRLGAVSITIALLAGSSRRSYAQNNTTRLPAKTGSSVASSCR
jgi:hypothetical protein